MSESSSWRVWGQRPGQASGLPCFIDMDNKKNILHAVRGGCFSFVLALVLNAHDKLEIMNCFI